MTRARGAPLADGIGLINLHMLTPETDYTTHYFYRNAYRFHAPDPAFKAFWHGAAQNAFAEDRLIIEAQQRQIGARDLFEHEVVSFGTDRLAIQGRRILERMEIQS